VCERISWQEILSHTEQEKAVSGEEKKRLTPWQTNRSDLAAAILLRSTLNFPLFASSKPLSKMKLSLAIKKPHTRLPGLRHILWETRHKGRGRTFRHWEIEPGIDSETQRHREKKKLRIQANSFNSLHYFSLCLCASVSHL
jgi:hypothetical protein